MARSWRRLAMVPRALLAAPAVSVTAFGLKPTACSSREKAKAASDSQQAMWISGISQGCTKTLPCKFDLYGGVIINPDGVPKEEGEFREMLASSLEEWKKASKRGVWLHLSIEAASLIPIATKEFGFEFHHAERDHVMMTKWLPTNAPNTLPHNASHTVGIGAVVTNSEGKVLLVQERSGPAARNGLWKIPTGMVDAGEDLEEAAIREVREETGIEAEFENFGAFTISHGGNLAHEGKTNLFFICKCRARSNEIRMCQSELSDARWFTQEEWAALPFPEKGTLWWEINHSATDSEAVIRVKELPWGKTRPDMKRTLYFPVKRSAL